MLLKKFYDSGFEGWFKFGYYVFILSEIGLKIDRKFQEDINIVNNVLF